MGGRVLLYAYYLNGIVMSAWLLWREVRRG